MVSGMEVSPFLSPGVVKNTEQLTFFLILLRVLLRSLVDLVLWAEQLEVVMSVQVVYRRDHLRRKLPDKPRARQSELAQMIPQRVQQQ